MNAQLDRLPILILYPHNRCNCRCVMCDIWKTDQVKEISAIDLDRRTWQTWNACVSSGSCSQAANH